MGHVHARVDALDQLLTTITSDCLVLEDKALVYFRASLKQGLFVFKYVRFVFRTTGSKVNVMHDSLVLVGFVST